MELSITITDLIALIRQRRNRDRDRLFKYLDTIAAEATELIGVWEQNYSEMSQKLASPSLSAYQQAHAALLLSLGDSRQVDCRSALVTHYERLSTTFRGRVNPDVQEALIQGLSRMIVTRDRLSTDYVAVREVVTAMVRETDCEWAGVAHHRLMGFKDSLTLLKRTVGEFRALVEQFKAT